jgi:molybdopterin-guanine dinucleotide biosynthesis protein A
MRNTIGLKILGIVALLSLIDGASVVVLAGGKSSRMGRPKALLPFGDEPLIVHIVCALRRIFPEIVVVAPPGKKCPRCRSN